MKFEDILPYLKDNQKGFRTGWNGKNLWVQRNQNPGSLEPCFCIYDEKTRKTNIWVPSISDIFAEDWELHLTKQANPNDIGIGYKKGTIWTDWKTGKMFVVDLIWKEVENKKNEIE